MDAVGRRSPQAQGTTPSGRNRSRAGVFARGRRHVDHEAMLLAAVQNHFLLAPLEQAHVDPQRAVAVMTDQFVKQVKQAVLDRGEGRGGVHGGQRERAATPKKSFTSRSALAGLSKFIGPPWTGAAGVS